MTQFGDALSELHTDPRDVFFYPDIAEPTARTYEAVIRELRQTGIWVPARIMTHEELVQRHEALMKEVQNLNVSALAAQQGAEDPVDLDGQVPASEVEAVVAQYLNLVGSGAASSADVEALSGEREDKSADSQRFAEQMRNLAAAFGRPPPSPSELDDLRRLQAAGLVGMAAAAPSPPNTSKLERPSPAGASAPAGSGQTSSNTFNAVDRDTSSDATPESADAREPKRRNTDG